MPNWKKVIVSGSDAALAHLTASGNFLTAGTIYLDSSTTPRDVIFSYNNTSAWQDGRISGATIELRSASTRRVYINSTGVQLSGSIGVNGNTIITGSASIGTSSLGASENTLTLGAAPGGGVGEGGQLGLNAAGGTYTSASMLDNWQNQFRILRGTNASSDALVAQWNMHTKQMSLPAYNSVSAFAGTAAANLAVDSSGNIITVSTSGGTVFPYNGNAVITGSLTVTGAIYAQANGAMYFQGGDDAALYDINVANTMGVYGVQDSTIGSIKLGSGGGTISGKSSNIGINTTNPTSASLTIGGNVWATSLTGSLQGTASWASNVTTATNATNIAITNTTTGTGPYYPVFVDATTGNKAALVDGTTFTYNATTNTLTVTSSLATTASYSVSASYATTANQLSPGGTTGFIPQWTSNTQLGDSVIYQKTGRIGINTGVVSSFGADLVINDGLIVTGSTLLSGSVDTYGSFQVRDTSGVPSADLGAARILRDGSGNLTLNYANQKLYGAGGVEVLDWRNARLLSSTTGPASKSVDWDNRWLYSIDYAGVEWKTVKWNDLGLYDLSGIDSIGWGARRTYDASGQMSIHYGSRVLGDANGNSAFEWDATGAGQRYANQSAYYLRTQVDQTTQEGFANVSSNVFLPEGRILEGVSFNSVSNYDFVYLNTNGVWESVDNVSARATKMLGVAFNVGTTNCVLLEGHMPINAANTTDCPYVVGLDEGIPIYVSSSGAATTTIPTGAGKYVRILGHAYFNSTSATDYWAMNFRPDHSWVLL